LLFSWQVTVCRMSWHLWRKEKCIENVVNWYCHDIRHIQYDIRHLYIRFHPNYPKCEALLIIPCEVAAKSVVPAVKALMAKELVEKRGFNQDRTAKILGISQSAVSKYTRQIRGHAIRVDNIEDIQPVIGKMADLLSTGSYRRAEFLKLFCQACSGIRRTGVMCRFCKTSNLQPEIEECRFCLDDNRQP